MTYNEIIQNLKKKNFHPIYILMGEEPYFIDKISDYIADNALPEEERSFNQTIIYGKDGELDLILTAAKRFPMMAANQVVIVREAQNIKNLEDGLLSYAESPQMSTILVICYKYKTMDKRKKLLKLAESKGVVFESKKIYDNQLIPWINSYCSEKGYQASPQASAMLAEFLGTEISKVVNELDKLMILLPKGATITPEVVEKNIGISKDFNVFELNNALAERDILKANRIITYFGANPTLNPIQKTITMVFYFFSRVLKYHFLQDKSKNNAAKELGVSPFLVDGYMKAARTYPIKKLVEIVAILREYDAMSKGVGNVSATGPELQREMIYKILH